VLKQGVVALVCVATLLSAGRCSAGAKFHGLPVPPGARRAKKTPLKKAIEDNKLSEDARLMLSLAADLADDEGSEYAVFKSSKSVADVMLFYEKFAGENDMPDVISSIYDNTKGKKNPEGKHDSAGSISLSLRDKHGVAYFTIAAFRPEKSSTTTIYLVMTKGSSP